MSIATQIGRIAKAKKEIKEVVNQDFEIINNETIDKYAEKMESAYDEYESYIPWEHGEGDEFTFKKGGTGSYLKELEVKGNTHQTTIAAETGKEVIETSINVNDVNIEKENYITLKGNTHQDSYTGKNLLDIPDGSIVNQGVTVTRNNNVITFSGTSTGTYPSTGSFPFTIAPGTYTISSTNNNYDFFLWFRNSNSDLINSANLHKGTKTITITSNNITALVIGVENLTTGTTYNIETSIQIEQGETATSFEPYVGGTLSPNPDYPQDVKVVTGNNTIKVHGKNLFDKDSVTIGYINADGTLYTSDTDYRTSNYIPIQPNTAYYKTFTDSPRTKYFDKNKQPLNTTTYQDISIGGSAGTFTTPENAKYLRFSYKSTGQYAIDENTIMINLGSTATTYEPYQSQDYEIDLGDIELYKIGDYQDYIYKENNKWYKYGAIRKYTTGVSAVILSNGTYRIKLKDISNLHDITSSTNIYVPSLSKNAIIRNQTGYSAPRYNQGWGGLAMAYSVNVSSQIGEFETTQQLLNWFNNNEKVYIVINPVYDYIDITEITDTTLIEQLEALYTAQIYNPTFIETTTSNLLPYINLKYNVVTPSPSPERPSDIAVVSGDNTINVHGKNLLDLVDLNRTNNGITAIVSDEIVTLNGTANANAFLRLDKKGDNYFFNLKPGTYTLSANNTATLTSNDYLRFVTQNGVGISGLSIPLNTTNASSTFTINENLENIQLQVRISSGTTLENFIIKPQLEESPTATSYEPYHNQDYEIDLHGKNLCSSTELQSAANIRFYIDKKIEKTLTISFTTNENLNNNSLYLSATDALVTRITAEANTKATATFTLSDEQYSAIQNATNPYFLLYKSGANFIVPTDAQIENGLTATDYEPYYNYELCKIGDYKDSIKKSTGKNLFDKDNDVQLNTTANFNSTEDNIYTINQTSSRSFAIVKVPSNSEITISTNNPKYSNTRYYIAYLKNKTTEAGKSTSWITNTGTFTTTSNTEYLGIVIEAKIDGTAQASTQELINDMNIQIEQNPNTTEYEPYGEQWYIKKEIGKVVLDGSEFWGYGGLPNVFYTTVITDYALSNNIPYSNYYIGNTNVNSASDMSLLGNNTIAFINVSGATTPRFYIKDTRYINNINDLKLWLSNNPITVYFILATPTYETITNETLINQLEAIEKLDTYNNYTAVIVTGDLINPELECVLFSQPAYQK